MNGIDDDFIDSYTFWYIPFINIQMTVTVMYHVGAIDMIRCKWCVCWIWTYMKWDKVNKWGWFICISSGLNAYLRFPVQLQSKADWLTHQDELCMPKLCIWGVVFIVMIHLHIYIFVGVGLWVLCLFNTWLG